jgi:hypothetical protein
MMAHPWWYCMISSELGGGAVVGLAQSRLRPRVEARDLLHAALPAGPRAVGGELLKYGLSGFFPLWWFIHCYDDDVTTY